MCSVIKILYLILFYLIYRITDLVLLVVMLMQIGLNIFSGEPSESVKLFGKSLGAYLQQISEFLSYASEEKPFPFSDWPEVSVLQSEAVVEKVDAERSEKLDRAEITKNESSSKDAGETKA
jgi:hypothetical protein